MEDGLCRGYVLAPFVFSIFFAAVINVAYTRFKEDKGIIHTLVRLQKKTGAGGYGKATTGGPALTTWRLGMLHADPAEIV